MYLPKRCHVLKSNFLKSSRCDLRCINTDNYKEHSMLLEVLSNLSDSVIPGENPWPCHRDPGTSWSFWHRKGQHGCAPQGQQVPPACGISTSEDSQDSHARTLGEDFWLELFTFPTFFPVKLGDSTGCLTASGGFRLNALELIRLIGVSRVNGQGRRQPVIWIFFGSGRG